MSDYTPEELRARRRERLGNRRRTGRVPRPPKPKAAKPKRSPGTRSDTTVVYGPPTPKGLRSQGRKRMLTPEVEAEIVRLTVEDKLVAREVAAMYGIGDRHVRDIVHRELGHVDRRKQGWTTPKTRDRTKRILEAKARGETIADIARAEGCHTETIYRALRKA